MSDPVPPAVSVIVPVYADWDRVPLLLGALAAQTWTDFELLLVDNGPEPWPGPLRSPVQRTRLVHCPQKGSYAARNAGAAEARGEVLAFTDSDCLPSPGWLAGLMAARRDVPELLAGPVEIRPGPRPNPWEIFDTVRGIPQKSFIRHGYAATANLSLPRGVFAALGGFDATRLSGGDAEFCRRARTQGHPLRYVPDAVVDHPARASRQELVTKARRIKGGQVAAGPLRRRVFWTVRSLCPPLREIAAYVVSSHPLGWRLTASAVRLRLWGVEIEELVRLLVLRQTPERR
ncbi:glycosyltransferase family 2 protein [Rubellimicrobium roseum]|uniref:Glycosyltransferase n=1 Tax=Rubellimicrobium roseum TaxID=687525 RepID=A0A5C4NGS4_9RHOB|nr:glycosyltransferase [Rubellimicrobium roseum]TNC73803.1 glycosyltransferase [Rubellimicrobium roseum]